MNKLILKAHKERKKYYRKQGTCHETLPADSRLLFFSLLERKELLNNK